MRATLLRRVGIDPFFFCFFPLKKPRDSSSVCTSSPAGSRCGLEGDRLAGVVERGFVLVRVGGRRPVGSSTFCVDRQLETHSQQTRSVARQRRPERDLAGIIDPQSQISLNTAVSRRNFFFLRYSFQFCSNHVPPPVGSSSHLCLSLPYL